MKIDESVLQMNVFNASKEQRAKITSAAEEKLSNTRKSFDNYIVEAFSKMNDQQIQVGDLEKQYLTDPESVNIENITTAMAKAQMSLTLAKTVVDRLITGWNEITTTR